MAESNQKPTYLEVPAGIDFDEEDLLRLVLARKQTERRKLREGTSSLRSQMSYASERIARYEHELEVLRLQKAELEIKIANVGDVSKLDAEIGRIKKEIARFREKNKDTDPDKNF